MASQLQIANWALTLTGQKRINALSDDRQNAELIADAWDQLRDALLMESAWSFAIERESLAADADEPAWGFDYQYSLNGDVVRVMQVSETYPGVDLADFRAGDNNLYRIEGRKILTNIGAPLYVKWLVNSKDVGQYDPSFARLLAADLAEYIAPRVVAEEAVQQRLERWRYRAWTAAVQVNAIEQPTEAVADDTWMAARNA